MNERAVDSKKSVNIFYTWLMNHLSYMQIYSLIGIIFCLAALPISFFWVRIHVDRINSIDAQLKILDEEFIFEKLFIQLQEHRALSQRLFFGSQKVEEELLPLENQINITLKQAVASSQKQPLLQENPLWQKINPEFVRAQWNLLMQQTPQLSAAQNEAFHTKILNHALIQFSYLNERIGLNYSKQITDYSMVASVFLRLPFMQENLSQLFLLAEESLAKQDQKSSNDQLIRLTGAIQADLNYLQQTEDIKVPENEYQNFFRLLNEYLADTEEFLYLVQQQVLASQPFTKHTNAATQIMTQGNRNLKTGFQLWDEGLYELKYIFSNEKAYTISSLWTILLLSVAFISFAFCLGLTLVYKATSRVSELTKATYSFTNGDLTARVSTDYNDQIGLLGKAFNHMAQKLEKTIEHLYELLNATTALSNGDLTARISTHPDHLEFDQVARSFNKMAEKFETIIGRLQEIGVTLTASATSIAATSQEQETSIVQQEATTREIAVAAHTISSIAKDFAHTVNDVSQAAEHTSTLAFTGKSSLQNMESIMRHMVNASAGITSKLAILNEKASNITSVVTTITKVADQTNLLSLNASIEAEKAGEFGLSFAVIAREIRRLADQTALATLDIEKMVHEIIGAISSSVIGVDDFTQDIYHGVEQVSVVSEQLTQIIEHVQAFTARFESVNQGMQTQSTGAEQINDALIQLSQTAQQITESIHQFHKTIQELNQAAHELHILTPFVSYSNTKNKENSSAAPLRKPLSFQKNLPNM